MGPYNHGCVYSYSVLTIYTHIANIFTESPKTSGLFRHNTTTASIAVSPYKHWEYQSLEY